MLISFRTRTVDFKPGSKESFLSIGTVTFKYPNKSEHDKEIIVVTQHLQKQNECKKREHRYKIPLPGLI